MGFIKKIASGNFKGSAKTIMTANPVGASCARVCPTEELCEGSCVLNHSTKPIMIGNLQRYSTDWAIQNKQALFKAGKKNGKKVAIVGSGPAGLSAARELALLGYSVTIFEAEKNPWIKYLRNCIVPFTSEHFLLGSRTSKEFGC